MVDLSVLDSTVISEEYFFGIFEHSEERPVDRYHVGRNVLPKIFWVDKRFRTLKTGLRNTSLGVIWHIFSASLLFARFSCTVGMFINAQ